MNSPEQNEKITKFPELASEDATTEALTVEDLIPEDQIEEYIIVMENAETGEEIKFIMADDFEFNGQLYIVLVTAEGELEVEITRFTTDDEGNELLTTLEDEEFDLVVDHYALLCEEASTAEHLEE